MTTTITKKVLSLGSYICMWFIFLHGATIQMTHIQPLHGTMYLIVIFYAIFFGGWGWGWGWSGGRGKRSVF